jgi:hypothetical protein
MKLPPKVVVLPPGSHTTMPMHAMSSMIAPRATTGVERSPR